MDDGSLTQPQVAPITYGQPVPPAVQPMGGAPASRSAMLAAVLHAIGQGVSPGATGMPSFNSITPQMIAQMQASRGQYAQNAATNAAHAADPNQLMFNKPDVAPTPWHDLPTNGFQGFGQNFSDAAKRFGGLFGLGSGASAGMGPNN